MPCNSDYLEPTKKEKELQRTARLLRYVYRENGTYTPYVLEQACSDNYCSRDYVAELCAVLTKMPTKKRDALVYNARHPMARQLADWWEEHQKADEERVKKEKTDVRIKKQRAAALAKLTKTERKILGLA